MLYRITAALLGLMILMTMAGAGAEEITVPSVQVEAREIPDNEALRMIRDMKIGWNLGNTFDAIDCTWLSDKLDYESGWCGVKTSEALIQALKDAGFRTVRVPVSWHNHVDQDYTIDEAWLSRVEEVVSWIYDRDMYVILNIHHDEDQFLPSVDHYAESARYVERIWSQLAERFRNYGARLIMESMNEPRLVGSSHEWWWVSSDPECREAADCLNRLNQLFVDTVRADGGENANRYLMVPAYDASPAYACDEQFKLPEDTAENRIIVSAHAYTPYSFALQMPGTASFDPESAAHRADINAFMNQLYSTYVSKGIPVLIGEFGALEKKDADGDHMQDRVDFTAFYVASARARGMTACWWDNHAFSGDGEKFGLIDRKTLEWKAPKILEAMMSYCGE